MIYENAGQKLAFGFAMAKALSIAFGVDLEVTPFYIFLSVFVSSAVGVLLPEPAARDR